MVRLILILHKVDTAANPTSAVASITQMRDQSIPLQGYVELLYGEHALGCYVFREMRATLMNAYKRLVGPPGLEPGTSRS